MDVYEATSATPDQRNINRDYHKVIDNCSFDYHREVDKGTPVCSKLIIDKDNILHLEAWEPSNQIGTMQNWRGAYKVKK